MLPLAITKRLTLARYLYGLALENSRSDAEVASFAAINLLHDAIEVFLLACAERLNAAVGPRTVFEQYIELIDEKLAPKELPLRRPLVEVNKIRTNAKHHAITPKSDEVRRLVLIIREFFDGSSLLIFNTQFWAVTLVDQLDGGESQELLRAAEDAYRRGDWMECLVACRRAFFIEFERPYDIKDFEDPEAAKKGIFGPITDAPYFTRNKEYIDSRVNDPFGFIVLDHAKLERDLLSNGIDPTVFWNIWRLSPEVYRHTKNDEWVVKFDFDTFDADSAKERATYVLEHSIQIILQKHTKGRASKVLARKGSSFAVKLKNEGVAVYRKADRTSPVAARTPAGVRKLMAMSSSPGLKGDGVYWSVAHVQKGNFFIGFVHEDDVDGPPEPGFKVTLDAE